ncbi:MAG: cytochrome P450 [Acidimicrobiales bacterium]|jgi:cytochrome P450|nr:cytochrome P450 [Acidimicrobiales bacterium]
MTESLPSDYDSTYSHLAHANDLEPSGGHRVLRQCPIHREADHDPPFYVVSRYDDVLDVLKNNGTWGNRHGPGVFFQENGVLGSADDPDHRRQRGLLQPAFRPRALARLEPRVEALCAELWEEAFSSDGAGDFVELFAFPFPALMIGELLGVEPGDRDRFGRWSQAIVTSLGDSDMDAYDEATRSIWAYVDDMVDARLAAIDAGADPPDDVVTLLTQAVGSGGLSRDELRRLAHQLLVAGHETTASLIGLMLYRLIENPALRLELREEPELIDSAVEEFLRFDSPVQGLFRTARDDASAAAYTVPARSKLQVLYASANRDPAVWANPDEIRLHRDSATARQHLGFGWGVHYCIGAPLARIQAQHALRRIVDGFESVELDGHPTLSAPFVLRGFTAMPIRWTVRR